MTTRRDFLKASTDASSSRDVSSNRLPCEAGMRRHSRWPRASENAALLESRLGDTIGTGWICSSGSPAASQPVVPSGYQYTRV